MFELYQRRIPLDDPAFSNFISEYFQRNNVNNPEKLPYAELYAHVRNAIREFLHLEEPGGSVPRNNK